MESITATIIITGTHVTIIEYIMVEIIGKTEKRKLKN